MSSKKLEFFSYGNTIDATNYCSGIETIAENFIEENEDDATIVYPSSNGWITARNDDEYRVTTENAKIILPLPIYKIRKVLINIGDPVVAGTNGYLSLFVDENGNKIDNLDITKYVLHSDEWASLMLSEKDYLSGVYRDNTFRFSNGATMLFLLNDVYEKFLDKTPVSDRLLRSVLYNVGDKYYVNGVVEPGSSLRDVILGINKLNVDFRNVGFRIEYIPLTSKTKIRARKSEKTSVDYFQAYNQRAEINAASALGKNMWLTAQKTGVKKITIVKRYTKIADIPRVGAKVIHNGKTYRICANHYSMTNTVYVQVTHTLSENWTMRSNHVALDQKYRNWNIPQDMLWRTLYIEEFAHVSFEKPTETKGFTSAITNTFNTDISNDKTVTHFVFKPTGKELNGEDYTQVVLPCMTYGVANSLVVSSTFKDNLSAGLRKRIIDGNEFCEDVLYCDKNGEVKNAEIILTSGLTNNVSEDSIKNFPASSNTLNTPKDRLFGETFQVLKDAGEALKITYQQHFISDSPDIVIGKKLAENCPIVKKWQSNRTMLFLLLNAPLRLGEDVVPGENVLNELDYATCVVVNNDNISVLFDDARAVAWAITDERYNLLIGSNAATKKTIYFSISNKK